MYDTKSLVVLMKLAVVAMAGSLWAWQHYWPEQSRLSAGVTFGLGFFCGTMCCAIYFLTRYARQLTPARQMEATE